SDERMIFTSGTGIMDVLLKKAKSIGVELLKDVALLDLVTQEGQITGALGLYIRTGELIQFRTKAVIMATGGWHKAFWPNTGMRDLSGEGIAMAHRAGADLGNMEFITFCCNVFYSPPMVRGSIAPYMLSLICGGKLTNTKGEDVLRDYDPFIVQTGTSTEWNKSFISYATMMDVRQGNGTKNGGVYYSRGDAPWENMELVASVIFPNWKYKSIDLSEWGRQLKANEPVEVGPAVEYFDGGIVVNDKFETSVPGLFAAGECTLGTFGANRVFSAITEMLVHGADAGVNAGEYVKSAHLPPFDKVYLDHLQEEAEQPLKRKEGLKPAQIRRRVQEAAHKHLGPVRNKAELENFIKYLKKVAQDDLPNLSTTSKSRIYNKEWIDALELTNMRQLLEISARSALARTESRGVHFREDFPHTDNDIWLKESIVQPTDEGVNINHRPVTVTSMTPPSGKMSYLDFMKAMMTSHSDTGGKH
ncbi:MAG: FAD-binding protein, partial [Desulfobacterales bacterium]|nr:FAD-binding protein [Desulfobacterales bacterium]